ncbi:MAG: hypothetical protein RR315_00150 [Oscillospiraceae bacterium]
MIKLIVGHKGLGKTKTMIEMANTAVHDSKGNVVCIEKGLDLTYNLDHNARLVDINQYQIESYDGYYGFLCGLMAGNYDITHIFCDAVFKACGKDMTKLDKLIERLSIIAEETNTDIIMLLSCDPSELSEKAQKLVI